MCIVGVVVLYNPECDVLDNIQSYINELDCLFVCDNSDIINKLVVEALEKIPKVKYISFGHNKGISYALNTALKLSCGCYFLLTMDQDSKFYPGMMKRYKNFLIDNYFNDNTIAMYSVNYIDAEGKESVAKIVERAITSGSIVNVQIAKKIGGFDENLFIDEVDYEFCYRANKNGYKILYLPDIRLQHYLGNPIQSTFLGKQFMTLNHNATRKYYIARNNIYIMKKYPEKRTRCIRVIIVFLLKIILMEPDKKRRVLFMMKGIKDGIIGRMGYINIS